MPATATVRSRRTACPSGRTWIAVVGGGLVALVSAGLTPSVAAGGTSFYVVQGLPSRTVSVTVDGNRVVGALVGGKVAGPFEVKSGMRTVTIKDGDQALATRRSG